MSGSKKDWGHGKKVKKLPMIDRDPELKTTKGGAANPYSEDDSPMNNPLKNKPQR